MRLCPLSLSTLLVLAGCGGSPPPEATAPVAPPKIERATARGIQLEQEMGSIEKSDVERTFSTLQPGLVECHKRGLARVEYEDGEVKFFLRIGKDGRVKWGWVEESTLGDHQTEDCMMTVLGAAEWPKPVGGEAEVRRSIAVEVPGVRRPSAWHPDRIAPVLAQHGDDLAKCKAGRSGPFVVTAYVKPHKKAGEVFAVGVAVGSKELADKRECVVDAVKGWKMPSPGSYPAKVTFTL